MTVNIKPNICYWCNKEYSFSEIDLVPGANIAKCTKCNRTAIVEI